MNETLTKDTQAVVLLCVGMGDGRSPQTHLSPREYASLVRRLMEVNMRPGDLLQKENIGEAAAGTGIDLRRLESLLAGGVRLGFAAEEWRRHGIWVISRGDPDYPARYKKRLKNKAPPLLFGAGHRSLLAGGGLGIVGSRNVDEAGEDFARGVARDCAGNRMPVVSGGARGVDQIAMAAALEADGAAIGILAENLLRKSVESSARQAIAGERLLLLSPYPPEARFFVANAMERNKLIYAMADYCLIVSAEYEKGGTWAGAKEELKRENPVPVFVRIGNGAPQGNGNLLDLGAIQWPDNIARDEFKERLQDLSVQSREERRENTPHLFDSPQAVLSGGEKRAAEKAGESGAGDKAPARCSSVYEAVLPLILDNLENPTAAGDLAEKLQVSKPQLNEWLKEALSANKITKLSKPVRYQRANPGMPL